jgi:hypothetical protein
MRKLVVFLGVTTVLLAATAAFDWWVDPFGQLWKPDVLHAARSNGCLVSEELIGSRYWSFKRDVFAHRPTREFVVGSSRVLKLTDGPHFSNLGYPGTSPETILRLFRSLPARPRQTVYLGTEAFWFNRRYTLPRTDLTWYQELEYALARSTFRAAYSVVQQKHWLLRHRWRRSSLGRRCVLDRFYPAISWRTDGSRVWGWEIDPQRFPKFRAEPFTGDLSTWRNGYYADWQWDAHRVAVLRQALALAKERGWRVVGFAPPEPPHMLRVLRTLPGYRRFAATVPPLFDTWVDTADGAKLGCRPSDFPDAFHSNARCSNLLLRKLQSVAFDKRRASLREIR